jgi:hypothetical protein
LKLSWNSDYNSKENEMGLRGELFSTRVLLQNRTYFFNVKENRMGDLYLNIVESKNRDVGGFDRQSIVLFADDLQEFLKGFDESLRILEKEVRQKRQSTRTPSGDALGNTRDDTRGSPRSNTRGERRSGHPGADERNSRPGVRRGGHPGTDERNSRQGERPHKGRRPDDEGRRVIVKKRKDYPKK